MRDPGNIRAVEQEARPDMMGFILWPGSPRHVEGRPAYLPSCERVGVFVDPAPGYAERMARLLGLDYAQLHGRETPDTCRRLRRHVRVIKAISVATPGDASRAAAYDGAADLLLFDTKCPGAGGSGRAFDWSALDAYRGSTPFLLAGGVGPGDEGRVAALSHPLCAGVDINSRFETSPGMKDAALVAAFIRNLRRHEQDKPTL